MNSQRPTLEELCDFQMAEELIVKAASLGMTAKLLPGNSVLIQAEGVLFNLDEFESCVESLNKANELLKLFE